MKQPRMPRRELPDPYKVEIVLDSIAPSGSRLTTFALSYPRFVHSELLTHRAFSRNSASSRAIPSEKMRALVREHPALPVWWGKNQSGMQAREELSAVPWTEDERSGGPGVGVNDTIVDVSVSRRDAVKKLWLEARDQMVRYSDRLARLGLHKALCNRLTEPWMPITVLVSATSYANWFHLRDHKDAQPEIQVIATEMHYQYLASVPNDEEAGAWHLPYVWPQDADAAQREVAMRGGMMPAASQKAETLNLLKAISVGRCARVSYLTHDGRRDWREDVALHDKLKATTESDDPGHFSPFEHVAMALGVPDDFDAAYEAPSNFVGWRQYRKEFSNEAGPLSLDDFLTPEQTKGIQEAGRIGLIKTARLMGVTGTDDEVLAHAARVLVRRQKERDAKEMAGWQETADQWTNSTDVHVPIEVYVVDGEDV